MGGRYDDALGSTAGDPVNGQQEGSSYNGHFGSTFYHPLFVSHTMCLALLVLAYNLGNFLLRLCLSKAVRHWLLRSVRVKLIKIGCSLVRHVPRLISQSSEVSVPGRLFQCMLNRIDQLSRAPS